MTVLTAVLVLLVVGMVALVADAELGAVVVVVCSPLDVLVLAEVVAALVVVVDFVLEEPPVADSVPEVADDSEAVLLLPPPPPPPSFLMVKWLDHWYTVSLELSWIRTPYIFSEPSAESTFHLYLRSELSTLALQRRKNR